MPFLITLDANDVLKQLQSLQDNITGLDSKLGDTFMDWQRDDMNRKFPRMDGGLRSVSTFIYPRSRLQRRKGSGKSNGKQVRKRSRVVAGRPGSTRPILRPILFDKLKARMNDMLKEAAQWP